MDHTHPFRDLVLERSVQIQVPAAAVWRLLTNTDAMCGWMSEKPLQIRTSWEEGTAIEISGNWDGLAFQNRGTVLAFMPMHTLSYTHLSSLSMLPDEAHNYSVLCFTLKEREAGTLLQLRIRNFPTESIYRHLDFYWRVAPELIRKLAEANARCINDRR